MDKTTSANLVWDNTHDLQIIATLMLYRQIQNSNFPRLFSIEIDRGLHSSDFKAIIQRYRLEAVFIIKQMISHKPFVIWFSLS